MQPSNYTIVGNIVPLLVPASEIKPIFFFGVSVSPKEWGLSLANKRPLRRKK